MAALRCPLCDAFAAHPQQARGRYEDGSSKAEAAGAYPSAMCRGIAAAGMACPRLPRRDGREDEAAARPASQPVAGGPARAVGSDAQERPGGSAASGLRLPAAVMAAIEQARRRPPKWASVRNLAPAERAELLSTAVPSHRPPRTEQKPAPSNGTPPPPGAQGRPMGKIAIADLFLPGVFEQIEAWRAAAERAMQAIKAGKRASPPARLVITQQQLQPWARGVIWDAREPSDVRPMEPSTRHTPGVGPRRLDRRQIRRAARELG